MTLKAAIEAVKNRGFKEVNSTEKKWTIDDLIEQIEKQPVFLSVDEPEWFVDEEGVEQLDESGYRTGFRYDIIYDADDDSIIVKSLAGFLALLNATSNGGYYRLEELKEIENWLLRQPEPEAAYFTHVRNLVKAKSVTLLRLVYDGREYGLGAPELS